MLQFHLIQDKIFPIGAEIHIDHKCVIYLQSLRIIY